MAEDYDSSYSIHFFRQPLCNGGHKRRESKKKKMGENVIAF